MELDVSRQFHLLAEFTPLLLTCPILGAMHLQAAFWNPDATERREAMNLPVIVIAAVVTTVITVDHIKGPLFHDVAYCLNDGGAQTTRMCTGRVPP